LRRPGRGMPGEVMIANGRRIRQTGWREAAGLAFPTVPSFAQLPLGSAPHSYPQEIRLEKKEDLLQISRLMDRTRFSASRKGSHESASGVSEEPDRLRANGQRRRGEVAPRSVSV